MDNYQALQTFWDSFGIDAYDEQTLFDEGSMPAYPHITYEAASGGYMNTSMLSASIWDKNTSWAWIKTKVEEIRQSIGYGGRQLAVDGGYIWVKLPEISQFSAPVDSGDDSVKRIRMSIEVDFMTT